MENKTVEGREVKGTIKEFLEYLANTDYSSGYMKVHREPIYKEIWAERIRICEKERVQVVIDIELDIQG